MVIQFIDTKTTLKFIIDQISSKRFGIYLRYGDGDFNLMVGENDSLANADSELQKIMIESLLIDSDCILFSIPHHCKELLTLEDGMFPGNHEVSIHQVDKFLSIIATHKKNIPLKLYSSVALCFSASRSPKLVVELHKLIQHLPVLFIGNRVYSNEFLVRLFGNNIKRINTPHRDSFLSYETIFKELDSVFSNCYGKYEYFIIIMAAGCAGRGFSGKIYNNYTLRNYFILDYGSLLDYLYGINSRLYMDLDPPQKKYIFDNI